MKRYIRSAVTDISEESWEVRYDIASDPDTSSDTLHSLASSVTEGRDPLLSAICGNPNVSFQTLSILYNRFPCTTVEVSLASHPDTPDDMLVRLSEYDLRMALIVAGRTDISTDMLARLNEEYPDSKSIRLRLSERTDVPTDVISKLLQQSNGLGVEDDLLLNIIKNNKLTYEQQARIYRLVDICQIDLHKVCLFLAESDETPPQVLRSMAAYPYQAKDVRQAIYENPNTDEQARGWVKDYLEGRRK